MFWQNDKKTRFFDDCLAILHFLRKWLLRYFSSANFNIRVKYPPFKILQNVDSE